MKKYLSIIIFTLLIAGGVYYFLTYKGMLNLKKNTITIEEIKSSQDLNYPLAKFLPYENEYLKMEYTGPAKLSIKTKQAVNSKSFVEQFAALHGKDISNHTIVVE